MTDKPHSDAPPTINPWLKLVLDIGPLLLFFFANGRWGIFAATAVFMVAIVISMAVSYALTRHVPPMTIVSAVIVIGFGGLTLLLQDDTFVKVKTSLIYALFAAVLIGGLAFGRPLLAMVFDSVFDLDAEGWRKLTVRWALFFLALAVLNEIGWRTQSTDFWVAFKVFALLPLTFLFAALQYPLLKRHAPPGSPLRDED
jgi:intracellular septation protein